MTKIVIDIIIALFLIWFLAQRLIPAKGVKTISTQDLKTKLNDKNVQLLDVRSPAEYNGNHISQFKNLPLFVLPGKLDKLSKDKEVVVICQSGMRSTRACKILRKNGFEKVTNVKGGMNAWS